MIRTEDALGGMLTLASGSPRRAKILADAGVSFVVLKTDAPEVSFPDDPERTVRENALLKWRAAVASGAAGAVLAADTIVWFGNKIYGKPCDLDEAVVYLHELSGQTHCVYTGVCFGVAGDDPQTAVETSRVTFRELSDATIAEYVARVHPTDRAGAYDIDESGELLVAGIAGEYENVMGLPLSPLRRWDVVQSVSSIATNTEDPS